MISPAKRRETEFSLKARKEPGERPTREGRKGNGRAATLEGARHYRWEAVAEITRALFFAYILPAHVILATELSVSLAALPARGLFLSPASLLPALVTAAGAPFRIDHLTR